MHAAQAEPSAPVYPTLHVQFVTRLLPLPENESDGHSVQVVSEIAAVEVEYLLEEHSVQLDEPLTFLNVPVMQAIQVSPSAPVYP